MARVHRGRRLCDARSLAVGWLGGGAGAKLEWTSLAGARLLAAKGRRLVRDDAGRLAADRSGGARHPYQLLRGRRLRPFRRQTLAERGGMGSGGARRAARRRLRDRVAMDAQRLSALSGLRSEEHTSELQSL